MWRAAASRRGAYGVPNTARPPLRQSPLSPRIDPRDAARAIREGASIGWRAFSAAVFFVAAAVLTTAGLTTALLSPRWLGIVLLVLATVALIAAVLEGRASVRIFSSRRRRRHDAELRRQLS